METKVKSTPVQKKTVPSAVIYNSGLWLVVYHNVKLVVRDVDGGGVHAFGYRVGSRELPLVHGNVLRKQTIPLEWRVDVGRDYENHFILPGGYISEHHGSFLAKTTEQGVVVMYEDRGSRNGSFFNNKKVGAAEFKINPATRRFEDVLSIGGIVDPDARPLKFDYDFFVELRR